MRHGQWPRRNVMNDRIYELLHRNLQEVFGEGGAVRRRAAIDELYTEDCVLYVPPARHGGMERRGCHGLEAIEPPQKIGRTSISPALEWDRNRQQAANDTS